jgi:hypothetical protein
VYFAHYASHRQQFLQYIFTVDETWSNPVMPITKKASMTWEHPYPLTPQGKTSKVVPQASKQENGICLVTMAFIDW